jgi:signal transduction histidine kinase
VAKFWRSSTARFILLVFGIELILAGGMTLTLRSLTRVALEQDARSFAAGLTHDVRTAYAEQGRVGARNFSALRLLFSEGQAPVLLMIDSEDRPLLGNLMRWPAGLHEGWNDVVLARAGTDQVDSIGVLVTRLPGGERLLAGQALENDQRLSGIVDRATGTTLIFALPLALFAAFAAVRIINARVDDINATAKAVSEGRLSQRVNLDGSGDTFDRLAITLNAMLDRTETLISELRIVTDGLAHDLRSPLTRLKVRLDRAETEQNPAARRTAIALANEEADRLLAMLTTALQISRAEAGIGQDNFEPFNLSTLTQDLAELYAPLIEDRDFDLKTDIAPGITVRAHRELMVQAIGNLIDNALKYGASPIQLMAGQTATHAWIDVRDKGVGIPATQRAEALRRFGRLDPSRTGFGAGLGLSLVQAVARLHGGAIDLGDAKPGLIIRLSIPL